MPPKRIILMYISEVSGHHTASLAIERSLKQLSSDCETLNINGFNYTNPVSEKIVNQLYMMVIKRTPKVWDYLYDNQEVAKKIEAFKNKLHKLNSPKLKKLFDKFKPDVIVCTQAFPCGMVSDYKNTYAKDTPLIAVLTDFVPHSYWIYDNIDYYVCPSEDIGKLLVKRGVPGNKILPLGIPFDQKFNEPVDKEKVIQKLKINPDLPTVLVMGGGQGLGPIKTVVKSLEKVKRDFQEIIITGTNKKLYKSLKRKIRKYKKKIILFGYVNNVSELMAVSDIIITKPGGITTSEALSKKIPMIILKPLPGQEAKNTVYLTDKKAAIKINKPKSAAAAVEDLLKNPEKLKYLSQGAESIAKPNAAQDIARFILNFKS